MTSTMEKSSFDSRRYDKHDLDLKEWSLKARISRENTHSRRFSTSNLKSFREDAKSFRSNVIISSTVSSPGYTKREEIDPSTYSFTTALKALQAKTVYSWEYLSQDGKLTLNSKWNEAEKYICNPLSGQVPLECLSAKTLSARSFRRITTMSAPLIYPSHNSQLYNDVTSTIKEHENDAQTPIQEKKRATTRDVGVQSTQVELSSTSSPSPVPTPSIEERSVKHSVTDDEDSPVFSSKFNVVLKEVEVEEIRQKECTEKNGQGKGNKVNKHHMMSKSTCQGKCLSFRGLWSKRKPNKEDQEKKINFNSTKKNKSWCRK